MPFSRITTNLALENESAFIDAFHDTMQRVLNIPAHDRLIVLDQKIQGFYQPANSSGKYILFEIKLFSGRTPATKKKLYRDLFSLANSVGVDGSHVNVILQDIDKINWGIRGGQPASEVDLDFDTTL